jgi:hypothetical protein
MLCFYFFFFGDPELESIFFLAGSELPGRCFFFPGWQQSTWLLFFLAAAQPQNRNG